MPTQQPFFNPEKRTDRDAWAETQREHTFMCGAIGDNGDVQLVKPRFACAGFGNNQVLRRATVRTRP
jgi:hypothetical protein